jgi:predicted GIY-YIG superfamily endonuclease
VYEFEDSSAYIGQTCRVKQRHTAHLRGGPVHNHIQVCPSFQYKQLQTTTNARNAIQRELFWITYYRQHNWTLLNVAVGGRSGPWSEEAKQRLREKLIASGKRLGTSNKNKFRRSYSTSRHSPTAGIHQSKETRQKISMKMKGKPAWNRKNTTFLTSALKRATRHLQEVLAR